VTPPQIPPDPPKYITVTGWGTPHGSLWDIAEDLFEDGARWRDIYAENRDSIGTDPGRLRVGMQLRLPPMEVYPAYVRSVGNAVGTEADDITAKLNVAKSRLSAIGNFWGNDSMGKQFYKGADGKPGYETMSTRAVGGMETFARFYKAVSIGLREMADRTDDTEWENTARVLAPFLRPAN
jgi:hypothetical protein